MRSFSGFITQRQQEKGDGGEKGGAKVAGAENMADKFPHRQAGKKKKKKKKNGWLSSCLHSNYRMLHLTITLRLLPTPPPLHF